MTLAEFKGKLSRLRREIDQALEAVAAFERQPPRRPKRSGGMAELFQTPDTALRERLRETRPEQTFRSLVRSIKPWCSSGHGRSLSLVSEFPAGLTVAKASILTATEWEKTILRTAHPTFQIGKAYRGLLKAWAFEHDLPSTLPPLRGLQGLGQLADLSEHSLEAVGFDRVRRYPSLPGGVKAHPNTHATWSVFTGLGDTMTALLFLETSKEGRVVSLLQVAAGQLSCWRGRWNLPQDVGNGERLQDLLVAFLRRAAPVAERKSIKSWLG